MPLDRDDVESSLRKKGFTQTERDHRFYDLHHNGQKTGIYTKTSRGKAYETLGDDLVSKMARQVKLTKPEFVRLVSCTMSGPEYIALLQQRNEL